MHRLRHTAASTVLASGASLGEIGGALRERSTVIYAKVDRTRLAELARQWPGSGR